MQYIMKFLNLRYYMVYIATSLECSENDDLTGYLELCGRRWVLPTRFIMRTSFSEDTGETGEEQQGN